MKCISSKQAVLLSVLLLFVFAACGGGTGGGDADTGSASMSLVWPDTSVASSPSRVVNSSMIPAGVVKVRVIFWADGQNNVQEEFPVEAGSGTVNGIPAGTWTLTVEGVDAGEASLYSGQLDGIVINSGHNTPCGTVMMAPIEGGAGAVDNDQDGVTIDQGDCDDFNNTIHPGAVDNCGDGIDQDCSGGDAVCTVDPLDRDDDGDGFSVNQGDCDDGNAAIHPGAVDIANDGIDQDCDGLDATATSPPLGSYGTVTSAGRVWLDRNLGASRVATSFDDAAAYGDLYQWGRGADGHEQRDSSTTPATSPSDLPGHGEFIVDEGGDWRSSQNDNLWQGLGGTNNPCPTGFRLPTETEWALEMASWPSNDLNGAFASPLKLTSAGYRYYLDGSLNLADGGGYYWTSTVDGAYARFLNFAGYARVDSRPRAYGRSVRCIKD